MSIKLSILDQSPVSMGKTPSEALQETVSLAKAADEMGYTRYWLAEHHNITGLTGTSPEILIAHIAGQTKKIRVGSGGVLLAHYSALKIAENFRMLHALFPGRIDLGIGRAPGGDYQVVRALQGDNPLGFELYEQKLEELLSFLHNSFEPRHPFAQVEAMPAGVPTPEIWLLGSSSHSAANAAQLGTAFSFAHFINGNDGPEVMQYYKRHFQPSAQMETPYANAAIFAVCAETEQELEGLVASLDLRLLRIEQGKNLGTPTVEEALSYSYAPHERYRVAENRKRMIYGTPQQMKEKIEKLHEIYSVDEFMVVTITNEFKDRLHSYELLAEAFDLAKASSSD